MQGLPIRWALGSMAHRTGKSTTQGPIYGQPLHMGAFHDCPIGPMGPM
jgi:hypothetical protein